MGAQSKQDTRKTAGGGERAGPPERRDDRDHHSTSLLAFSQPTHIYTLPWPLPSPSPAMYSIPHHNDQRHHQSVYSWPPCPLNDSYLFGDPQPNHSTDLLQSLSRWSLDAPDFLLPFHYQPACPPDLSADSSESSSILSLSPSSSSPPSPAPADHLPTHIVCNAPLVAPIPLPYHSPTFLQYIDLPDPDEDLSHPPYTRRTTKRKLEVCADSTYEYGSPAKRRSISSESESETGPLQTQRASRCPYVFSRDRQVRAMPARRQGVRA
ncbi:uncharacterized protein LAESUDRAFT_269635 [Laetiporus sulphureus 93-53]|uniref:Uncharacterized protein n=1 Tax=Laetiporus sulphureus 93-53 TaxID=1314785 RepID=A0A165H9D4_9APHY|nr:uncharacterized protein LAESUDRAFT_269635 [Laetiporus sulphureus 93-53]KZT11424.1 hypothetical protein LAESUDRAFT_269635 [Laetiporus sulphureus 93-53]